MTEDKDFVDRMWHSNVGKLCFENGYYDFDDRKFVEWDEDAKGVFTPIYIRRPYHKDGHGRCEKHKGKECQCDTPWNWVRDKIWNAIFIDKVTRQDFKRWLARAVAGKFQDKSWAVGIGNRNCGKGVLTHFLRYTLGEYVHEFNAEEMFIYRSTSGDVAKRLGWVLPLEFTRVNISNECKTESDSGKPLKLCGTMIKTLGSGGDEIKARQNHKDQVSLKIQGKILLMMNDMVEVAPENALETLSTFRFKTEFKEKLTELEIMINENDDGDYKYQVGDPNIKVEIENNVAYQDAFLHSIIEAFEDIPFVASAQTKANTADLNDTAGDLQKTLSQVFVFHQYEQGKRLEEAKTQEEKQKISQDKDQWKQHYLTVAETDVVIKDLGKELGVNINKSKYTLMFDRMGVVKKKYVGDPQSKDYNKYHWVGISRRSDQYL